MNPYTVWEDAFDFYMLMAVKLYYWPAFTIGIQDNITDIFNPKTYSICKI
jgi:hypothetical protein